jgi:hypothetical protein
MGLIRLKSFFAILIQVLLISQILYAQKQGASQLDYVKQNVLYSRWTDILKTKTEVSYDEFKLDDVMISPWHIRRVQEIGKANRGKMVQYVLAKHDVIEDAHEILLVSVTRCSTRKDATEGLLDHLLGIQRPDFRLIEDDSLTIGDLSVNIYGDPEPAILFIRGNIIISLENAGREVAPDLRTLAKTLDNMLVKKR